MTMKGREKASRSQRPEDPRYNTAVSSWDFCVPLLYPRLGTEEAGKLETAMGAKRKKKKAPGKAHFL